MDNVPAAEIHRSPAAQRVGQLAEDSGLLLAHFEQRWEPDWPTDWIPTGRPDLGEPQQWQRGVLPETKFRTFQLDRAIGSLHPAHSPKWTAHELCHGLIGFGWRPDATSLWRATAARLAELVPVALWYFLDESGLRRCSDHHSSGPLFGTRCRACEHAATLGPVSDDSSRWYDEGRAFLEAELAAIQRTRRQGRPVPHRYATLELCSDGLAYEAAHGARLQSRAFHDWVERFAAPKRGWHSTLDELEERVLSIFDHLTGAQTAPPWDADRDHWIAADIGWRLLTLRTDSDPTLATLIDQLVVSLADDQTRSGLSQCVSGYRALLHDWSLPSAGQLFGVGYPIPGGLGVDESQIMDGVASALPATVALMGPDAADTMSEFAHALQSPCRRPIGERFVTFLDETAANAGWSDQARFEAAIAHAPMPSAAEATLGASGWQGERVQQGESVSLITLSHGVTTDPSAVESSCGPLESPMILAIRRAPDGEIDVIQVTPTAAAAIRSATGPTDVADLDLDADEWNGLLHLGLLRPAQWEFTLSEE